MGNEEKLRTRVWPFLGTFGWIGGCCLLAPGCDQPPPRCDVAQSAATGGNFAARYTLVGKMTGKGDCDKLKGDTLLLGSYYKRKANDKPDYTQVSVGIQPAATLEPLGHFQALEVKPTCEDKPYAYGSFDSSEPNADNLCSITTLTSSRVCLPTLPAAMSMTTVIGAGGVAYPERAALNLTYKFENFEVYMAPESAGRQFKAELTYSKKIEAENIDCSAKYTISAIFPAFSCGLDMMGNKKPKAMADEECLTNPVLIEDAVECDLDLNLCVLAKPVPAFR